MQTCFQITNSNVHYKINFAFVFRYHENSDKRKSINLTLCNSPIFETSHRLKARIENIYETQLPKQEYWMAETNNTVVHRIQEKLTNSYIQWYIDSQRSCKTLITLKETLGSQIADCESKNGNLIQFRDDFLWER